MTEGGIVGDEELLPSSAALLFVGRFDDFLDHGVWPGVALGFVLTWVWMGLTEGYPIFMDGRIDLRSVIILLASFAVFMLCAGFIKPITYWVERPATWFVGSALMLVVSLGLLVLAIKPEVLDESMRMIFIRVSMVVIGAGTGTLVMLCATGYACLRPVSAGIGFAFAIAITFVAYFCLNVCVRPLSGVLFCLLPVGAAIALYRTRGVLTVRLQSHPKEPLPFAKGFLLMCVSFGVFSFAIGVKCAFEPIEEFAMASDTSVIAVLLVSLGFLYLIGFKREPLGVFHVLKIFYGGAVMLLAACIALAPLSFEPYIGIIFNADVMIIIMVFWLLTAFVAHADEVYVGKVVGLVFAVAAFGMLVGWTTGVIIYQIIGHDRSYPTIALACVIAVFSTVGFSAKSFPYLTWRGEGAMKMKRTAASPYTVTEFCSEMAQRFGLSKREVEVLELLVSGYGSDAIADKLIISYHTARTHVRNIYKKTDVHSQRELLDGFKTAKSRHDADA